MKEESFFGSTPNDNTKGKVTASADRIGAANWNTSVSYCNELIENGYSDWYLPSLVELGEIYANRAAIGSFNTGTYWSSDEANSTDGSYYKFDSGTTGSKNKNGTSSVRAIRAF